MHPLLLLSAARSFIRAIASNSVTRRPPQFSRLAQGVFRSSPHKASITLSSARSTSDATSPLSASRMSPCPSQLGLLPSPSFRLPPFPSPRLTNDAGLSHIPPRFFLVLDTTTTWESMTVSNLEQRRDDGLSLTLPLCYISSSCSVTDTVGPFVLGGLLSTLLLGITTSQVWSK